MALDFLAGCVGGCAGILVGHPLDTIKVRIQTQDFRNPIYRGTVHCFQTTVQKEGFRGLYKGMSSPMAGVAAVNAILFGVYGNMQRRMSDPDSLAAHFTAGAAAGLTQSFIASPMELAKLRVQLQQEGVAGANTAKSYSSPMQCIRHVYRTEGLRRGIFRGQLITILREVPGFGSYFMSYEILTRYFAGPNKDTLSTPAVLFAGGSAGCISWLISCPADVIKSRLQASTQYAGILDCYRQSIKEEGYRFLFRGLSSSMMRSFPTNAATFATVTWIIRLSGNEETSDNDGYTSVTEFNDDMLRVGLGTPAALPSVAFLARRRAHADRDRISVNGEEEGEIGRAPVTVKGVSILGTLRQFSETHDVESANLELL